VNLLGSHSNAIALGNAGDVLFLAIWHRDQTIFLRDQEITAALDARLSRRSPNRQKRRDGDRCEAAQKYLFMSAPLEKLGRDARTSRL
jgi:hypothetical protein